MNKTKSSRLPLWILLSLGLGIAAGLILGALGAEIRLREA